MQWSQEDFLRGEGDNLTYHIHDLYFDIRLIEYDEAERRWSVPIGEQKGGPYDRCLVVLGVTGYSLDDTEQVGLYDIHSMCFDRQENALRLKCNVPLGLRLRVSPDFTVKIVARGRSKA